jgi:hypothetical protein
MQNRPLTYRIVKSMRSSGRGGFPSVWHVFEIHARYTKDGTFYPLLRKDDTPRTFKSRQTARTAIRKMRKAEIENETGVKS